MYITGEGEVSCDETPVHSPWEIGFDLLGDRGRVTVLKFLFKSFMIQIVYRDEKWFVQDGAQVIELPSSKLLNSLWEAACLMVKVHVDDAGGSPERALSCCKQASKLLAGASQLCKDAANDYENEILYTEDEDELWYQK